VQALQAGQVMMSVCPSVSETNLQPDTSCASAATADCLHLETRRLSAGQQNNMKSLSCYCIRERERISIKIRPERGLLFIPTARNKYQLDDRYITFHFRLIQGPSAAASDGGHDENRLMLLSIPLQINVILFLAGWVLLYTV
jgi:hypothetical protein